MTTPDPAPPPVRAERPHRHIRHGLGVALAIAAIVLLWGCSKPGHEMPHPASPLPSPAQQPGPDRGPAPP